MRREEEDKMQGSKGTKLVISLQIPEPQVARATPPPVKRPPLEDQVREALELIESGNESRMEWILLNKIHACLKKKKKLSPRGKNIVKMIEPVLAHYGYHGVSSSNAK